MSRWWYAVGQGEGGWWDAWVPSAREKAGEAGAVLRSETPVFGWIAQNRRDHKFYPCRDGAQGAVPAWIWYGDIGKGS